MIRAAILLGLALFAAFGLPHASPSESEIVFDG